MAGKDFERQVRERIGEWDISPSDRVWQGLETTLLHRRRRRRYFALFLLSGLLIGAGAWFMLSGPRLDSQPPAAEMQAGKSESLVNRGGVPGLEPEQPMTEAGQYRVDPGNAIVSEGEPVKSGLSAGSPVKTVVQFPVIRLGNASRSKASSPAAPAGRQALTMRSAGETSRIAETGPEATEGIAGDQVPVARLSPVTAGHQSLTPVSPSPGLLPVMAPVDSAMAARQMPSPENITKTHTRKKSVVFGLSAGFGRSAFTDGLISSQYKLADAMGSGTGGLPPLPAYEYRQDPGNAFSLGAWMRMPLSKRWSWSAGLGYQRWSTKTPVGQALPDTGRLFSNGGAAVASSIGYSQGSQEDYRNDYHLLQLPLDLSWQLNRGRKLPVLWEFGVSPGLLLTSNALVRDSASALFSHPDNQRKFQFGMRSAIMFRLMPASSRPIDLGPVVQYELTPVFVDGVRDNGYLYFLGVEARVPIFSRGLTQRRTP